MFVKVIGHNMRARFLGHSVDYYVPTRKAKKTRTIRMSETLIG